MNILVFTYALNGFLMIIIPIGLAILFTRRWKLGWSIWWIGAGTFALSQLLHVPFNLGIGYLLNRSDMVYWAPHAQAVFNAIFLGLSAGIFEEGARFFILHKWGKSIRTWRQGIIYGAGHGGTESMILGVLGLYGFIQLLILHQATPQQLVQLVGIEKISLVQAQLATAWSAPWYLTMLGAVERIFTIPIQIFLAVLVLRAVLRQQIRWLIIAILIHTLVDGLVVFLQPYLHVLLLEGIIGLFAVASVIATRCFYKPELPGFPALNPVTGKSIELSPVDETQANLENSRFLG